jgi:hypothetical protein
MKQAIEWLNEMGETVAESMFVIKGGPPGEEVRKLIERIQADAIEVKMKALREIKLACLTTQDAAKGFQRILRLCIDAGVKEHLNAASTALESADKTDVPRKKVIQMRHSAGCGQCVLDESSSDYVAEEARLLLTNGEIGDYLTVTLSEMTQAELDSLGEFDGW